VIHSLFYKTARQFATEYKISFDYIKETLMDTQLGQDHPTATLLGMTELELLIKLGLAVDLGEVEDPRKLVYIIYNNI